jgi:hypothetical protein
MLNVDKQWQPMSLLQPRYRPQDAAMDNYLADDESEQHCQHYIMFLF